MLGLTFIKDASGNEILDVLSYYYQKEKLTLVEERIGTRTSKYTSAPKSYRNLQEYEEDAYPPSRPNFTTNFDLIESSEFLPEQWKILFFYPDYPVKSSDVDLAVSVNSELSQLLSMRLNTHVLQYANTDTVDYYRIRFYDNGDMVDFLDTSEGKIYSSRGYFETVDQIDNIYGQVEKYLQEKIGIDDMLYLGEFEHLLTNPQRRPLYLKGSPENILRFFSYQGKFE